MVDRFIEIEGKTFERGTRLGKTVFTEVAGKATEKNAAKVVEDEAMNLRHNMKIALADDWHPDKWKAWRKAHPDAVKFDLKEYQAFASKEA